MAASASRYVVSATAALMIGGGVVGIATGRAGATSGEGPCTQEHYEWSGTVKLGSFNPEFDTGIELPPVGAGETLRVLDASYVVRNAYPEEDPEHTRARDDQLHESFALFVGDTQVGGLTPDLPDSLDEGAPTEWFSGDQVGSFGSADVTGGRVVLKHSFLFGFDDSANSLDPQLITIDVERCVVPPETTTTTCTCPPTTLPETTTTTVEPVPTTELVATTVPATVPTSTTPFPTVPLTAPTTPPTTQPILVATGRTSGWMVGAGSASLLSGLTLLRVRRRSPRA